MINMEENRLIDFKSELIKNVEKGYLVDFFSESLNLDELIAFRDKHKDDLENESFDFEVETSEYFEHKHEDEVFDVVYLKHETVKLFGYNITMHLLNDEFMQSESTIIYQIERIEK